MVTEIESSEKADPNAGLINGGSETAWMCGCTRVSRAFGTHIESRTPHRYDVYERLRASVGVAYITTAGASIGY